MKTVKVNITLTLNVKSNTDAVYLIDCALDQGIVQDALEEFFREHDAKITITRASVAEAS